MQNLNQHKNPEKLAERRRQARWMIRMCIELIRVMSAVGCNACWEHPLRASSWQLPEMEQLFKMLPYKCRVDGCCFGMKAIDTGQLIQKSWRIQCATQEQARRIAFTCQGNHEHATLEGSKRVNASSYYPIAMCRRWIKHLLKAPDMGTVAQAILAAAGKEDDDEGEMPKSTQPPPDKEEVERVRKLLLKLHRNAAHCNNRTLAQVLRDDGTPAWIVKMALDLDCEICRTHSRP